MPNAISRDSFLIRNASNALTSFYDKQPVLAFITTVALPLITVIGFIFYIKINQMKREDDQHEKACNENLKKGYLKGAEESASKIYLTRIRDTAYKKISEAYCRRYEHSEALAAAEKITDQNSSKELVAETKRTISVRSG